MDILELFFLFCIIKMNLRYKYQSRLINTIEFHFIVSIISMKKHMNFSSKYTPKCVNSNRQRKQIVIYTPFSFC